MIDWITLGMSAVLAAAPSSPHLSDALTAEGCEFGDVYATTIAECDVTLSNHGDTPIRVSAFHLMSGESITAPSQVTVAPRSTAQVRVQIDTAKSIGKNGYILRFDTNPPTVIRSAKAKGFVLSSLDQGAPTVDFGAVDLTKMTVGRSYSLSSQEVDDFRIDRVLEAPDWLDVTLANPRTVSMTVKEGARWGLQEDYIRVAINTPRQREAFIKVKADLRGDIVPSENPLNLGLVRSGTNNEALLRLTSQSRQPFKIGKITVDGFNARTKVVSCLPKSDDCKMIRLLLSKKQALGSLRGIVHIELPDRHAQLPVATWGFLVPADYKIRDVSADPSKSQAAAAPPSLQDELKASTQAKKPESPPPPGDGPLLKWTASSLGTVYGFQIFRAESEDGPFLLMNPRPIHADMDDENAQTFQWRDNEVRHGATYYYSIGILRVDGKKEHLAGPQKIVAK